MDVLVSYIGDASWMMLFGITLFEFIHEIVGLHLELNGKDWDNSCNNSLGLTLLLHASC